MNENGMLAFIAVLGASMFIFVIIGIVLYVLYAIGLYKLAINANVDNAWLAWIPIANLYIMGSLVKTVKISNFDVPNLELVLPVASVAVGILNRVPVIGFLAWLAFIVLTLFVLHKLYSMYRPNNATVWLILGIVFPFLAPIFIFIMRNDTPVTNS